MPWALVVHLITAIGPSVSVDMSGLSDELFQKLDGVQLERAATLRLVQEQFAVVASSAGAAVVLRVGGDERTLTLTATGPHGVERSQVVWSGEPLAEVHLELVQKLVELARLASRTSASMTTLAAENREDAAERRVRLNAGVSLGAMLRSGGVDPLAVLELRAGTRIGATLDAGLVYSRGDALTIYEGHVALGPSVQLEHGRLAFDAAATAGVLVHSFSLDNSTAVQPNGTQVDLFLAVPVTVSFALLRQLIIGVRAAAGLTLGHEHSLGPAVLWQRGPGFGEAALFLGWRTGP